MGAYKTSTQVLQDAFPDRVTLGPKEIAQAIYGAGKDTKKRIEAVNRALNEGRLVPGLRKSGARWSVPIASLGRALDQQRTVPAGQDMNRPEGRRSSQSTIGPRMLFQQERAREVLTIILSEIRALEAETLRLQLEDRTAPARGRSRGTGFRLP